MKIAQLTKEHIGMGFTAEYGSFGKISGKIQYEGSNFYLCSNRLNGADCSNKLGYKFSYCLFEGSLQCLQNSGLEDLEISDSEWDNFSN